MFSKHRLLKDGLQGYCKPCSRDQKMKSFYGLDPEAMRKLMTAGCSICGSNERLHVDHDHSCCPGVRSCGSCVRGVLCGTHNRAIGMFSDDVVLLQKAIDYLTS